jgi:peptidyl-prolyl cis-trans isomerase SurA
MRLSRVLYAVPVLLLAVSAACKKSPPANVAASVNNRVVTYDELNKYYKLQYPSTDRAGDDEISSRKLDVLRGLVDNEMMLQRAEKLGLMATDADVDSKFNELKAPYTKEEFQRQLDARGMTVQDLKSQLRRDLSIQKLFNKEITSYINVSDKEVADFYTANKASFNFPEPQIHMAQILVTPGPDANARNLKNDKAQNDDQARRKIQMIDARLKQGEAFEQVAANYSEDPNSTPNGGDLGFIPESALDKANPELRKLVLSLLPGQTSQPMRTPEGYRILKVIAKEPAGQRALEDPRVQQSIRETLLQRKDQLLKAAYYEVARNDVKVVNYLAKSITEKAKQK